MRRKKVSPKHPAAKPEDLRERATSQRSDEAGTAQVVRGGPISSMRGFVRGIRTTEFREKKDRY